MNRLLGPALAALMLGVALPAMAHDNLQLNAEHGAVKDTIQHEYQTLPYIEDALVTLRRLIRETEASHGNNSPEIGLLLLDIGEGAVRRGLLLTGEEQIDGLNRGLTALAAGDNLVTEWERDYPQATTARARAYFMRARALMALGQFEGAELAMRDSLGLHSYRFGESAWQLQVFPFLFDAVQTPEKKLAVAQGELQLAQAIYGNNSRVDEAHQRVRQAMTLGNEGLAGYDAARTAAIALADANDPDAAYAALAAALPATPQDRTIFSARIKPTPFFIYGDPDASYRNSWDDLQKNPTLDAYDKVATRFMVDHDLQPYIEDGRNNLSTLLSVLLNHYEAGERDAARDFCRLLPPNYGGYVEATLPTYCDALNWADWNLSQGVVGTSTRLIEASLDLLPPPDQSSDAEQDYRWRALAGLLEMEAYYGSADTFFAAYEEVSRSPLQPSGEMNFYAAVISDNAEQALANLDGVLMPRAPNVQTDSIVGTRSITEKLSLVGGATAGSICTSSDEAIAPILRGVMCITGNQPDLVPYEAIERDIRSGAINRATAGVTDWPFLEISKNPTISAAIADNISAFIPGLLRDFTYRDLSPREQAFMQAPISHDDFAKAVDYGILSLMDEDFDPAHITLALLNAGELDLARSWASWGARLYETSEGPQTILTAYLAEEHSEQTYRDGWAWMMAGHPVLAEQSFRGAIPADLTYERGGRNYQQNSSLDWERTIGAYHGRMLARIQLGDRIGAAGDAAGLVDYVSFVLNLQSFTRHETREIVARVARPAMLAALDVFTESQSEPALVSSAFRAVQLLNQTGTATTVSRLGARLGAVSPELGELARHREALRARWFATDAGQDETRTELAVAIDALDQRLATEFPQYVELAGAIDLPLDVVQAQLRGGEAMISYTVRDSQTIAVVVTQDESHVVPIDIGALDLSYLVEDLRRSLDMTGGRLPSFRSDVAFDLYQTLLAPVEQVLDTRPDHLILALSGVLESVPFSVLVADEPQGKPLPELSWVVDRYSVARVPSVSSLVMMRQLTTTAAATTPFLGIGDPLLDGNAGDFRGLPFKAAFTTRGGVDSAALQSLPRLTETAGELRQLLQTLGGSDEALLLGEMATERRVKAMPLQDYRVVAFATHGLVAGEVGGYSEPGLVLTPPQSPDSEDDGYLSASEIAELNLNADLVLLSACNTAAPGEVGAEGLSGLAKAFFFAGAKALLVSHWSVESASAAELTTRLMQQRMDDKALSYAAALQKAMISLRDDADSDYAHPALWGSFEVVGG